MKYYDQYREKLRTPDEAVKVVKSGDWVEYTTANGFPVLLDEALSRRRDELTDVKIRGNLIFGPIQVVECDPEREHFIYNSWHCSAYERKLCDKGLCNYIPMVFRNVVQYYKHFLEINVAMIAVTPMDDHGYFNLSGATGIAKGILDKADVVILEVNENLPKIYGAIGDSIHISEADMVVEGKHGPLYQAALDEPTETDIKIAENIMPYISNSSTLQLGIGGLPGVIGRMIADSDLKDLGMHTELCSDAYYYIHEAGKLTNRYSSLNPGKGVLGIAFGTETLYEWIHENPGIISYPLEYVNSPEIIEKIDRMISINSCISTDLYGQVCAESSGTRQISGTGGQLDFLARSSHVQGRQGLHLHAFGFQGKGRHAGIQCKTGIQRRYRHLSEEPDVLSRNGVWCRKSGWQEHLGTRRDDNLHSSSRLPGRADKIRRETEHMAQIQQTLMRSD